MIIYISNLQTIPLPNKHHECDKVLEKSPNEAKSVGPTCVSPPSYLTGDDGAHIWQQLDFCFSDHRDHR